MPPLRWTMTEDGVLQFQYVESECDALSDLDPVDIGIETDAVELEREFGAEGGN